MGKKTISEALWQKVQETCKDLIDEYNAEKDPEAKLQIKYELAREVLKKLTLEISALTDSDFRKFCNEQLRPLGEAWEKIGKEYVEQKLAHGELSLQDLGLLIAESEIAEKFGRRRLTKQEFSALSKRRTIERLLALMSISNLQLSLALGAIGITLEPLTQLNDLVKRRFGADMNWSMALAILATHENLIKKKLIELGANDERIEQMSKQKGFGFLVELLESEIETKEKRKVSLSFYKSSLLRATRNKLEHEGYKQPVTKEDVQELLKDLRKFEAELFKQ